MKRKMNCDIKVEGSGEMKRHQNKKCWKKCNYQKRKM